MRKPVTILTGFLGAGKTTFLNHLIQKNPNVRYAIIENEYGEKSIDSELIFRPEDGIVELNNGCLCCTLNDNLYDILNDLFDRKEDFDEIIIEATGVADPAGLAEPFLSHPLIKEHFPLMGTVCIVDVEQVETQIAETEEALNQITFSETLVLNKTDLVEGDVTQRVKEKMKQINPLSRVFVGHKNAFPAFDISAQKEAFEKKLLQEVKDNMPSEGIQIKANHHHHEHEHTPNIVSFCFTYKTPFNYELLYHNLFVYLTFQAKGLYRIKGLLWLDDNEHQVVMQSVGKRMAFDEKRKWESQEKKESIIVFIGKDLQENGLRRLLEKCFSPENKLALKESH